MPLSRLNDGFEIELEGIAFGMVDRQGHRWRCLITDGYLADMWQRFLEYDAASTRRTCYADSTTSLQRSSKLTAYCLCGPAVSATIRVRQLC